MSSPEMGEEMEPRKETEKEESRKCEGNWECTLSWSLEGVSRWRK